MTVPAYCITQTANEYIHFSPLGSCIQVGHPSNMVNIFPDSARYYIIDVTLVFISQAF